MNLLLGDDDFEDPSREALLDAIAGLEHDQTITLEKSDSEFLDAYCNDPGSFIVQYREGTLEDLWSGPGQGVDTATLSRLFASYLAGDDGWRTLVAWTHTPM